MSLSISVNDSITLSDSLTVYPIVLSPSVLDSITLSESISFHPITLQAYVYDSLLISELLNTAANHLLVSVNDSIALSDLSVTYMSDGTNGVGPRRGRVVLNGITFLTDPGSYVPLAVDRRIGTFKVISDVAIQDFGFIPKDNIIKLSSSGKQGVIDEIAAREFHRILRVKGGAYEFHDWMGNSFNVMLTSFHTFPIIEGPLYEYTMDLQILSINTLFREVYTG